MDILLNFSIIFVVILVVGGKDFFSKKNLFGIGLCALIGAPSYFLGKQFPIIGGAVFGILLGIIIALLWKRPSSFEPGIKVVSKKLLQCAIVLFGFEMNLINVVKVGGQSLFVMIFSLTAAFLSAWIISKKLKLERNISILIGVGTAICGGSAIAATAPVIGAEDDEVATAISTIFLFNVLAVFIFPSIGYSLGLSDTGFGMWAGTAINDTSSVVAAAYSFSDAAGNLATIVKLTRSLMIVPITAILAVYVAKTQKGNSDFSFAKVFPWFILGFILASIINTSNIISPVTAKFLGKTGKLFIVLAMAAIGLNTNLKHLISNGKKPIFMGLCCWFAVAITSLIVQKFIGLI